ncbi:unnamed protein product [Effrenium voratum]|nr:unnamed protein product [Effrenium voratum]
MAKLEEAFRRPVQASAVSVDKAALDGRRSMGTHLFCRTRLFRRSVPQPPAMVSWRMPPSAAAGTPGRSWIDCRAPRSLLWMWTLLRSRRPGAWRCWSRGSGRCTQPLETLQRSCLMSSSTGCWRTWACPPRSWIRSTGASRPARTGLWTSACRAPGVTFQSETREAFDRNPETGIPASEWLDSVRRPRGGRGGRGQGGESEENWSASPKPNSRKSSSAGYKKAESPEELAAVIGRYGEERVVSRESRVGWGLVDLTGWTSLDRDPFLAARLAEARPKLASSPFEGTHQASQVFSFGLKKFTG